MGNSKEFRIFAPMEDVIDDMPKSELKVIIYLMLHQAMDDGTVFLNIEVKHRIAMQKGISLPTIKLAIASLVKKKVLLRIGTRSATYMINPIYMWCGSLKSREKAIVKVERLQKKKSEKRIATVVKSAEFDKSNNVWETVNFDI